MSPPTPRRRRPERPRTFGVPALLLLCVTLPHLGQGDWQRTDSGWYSAIAVQAWRSGELWTLHAQPGHPYFNKPPLVFWVHGLVMHAFGPGAWQARLPSVAAALACVLLTVSLARRLAGRRAAMGAGIVLALSVEFFRRTREVSLDLWQLAFMLGAARLAAEGLARGGGRGPARWFAAAGVPLGLALLCKPLVALAVPVLMGAWAAWEAGSARAGPVAARPARSIVGAALMALVALAVAAPWHASMALTHGAEFTGQYFGREVAERAAGGAGRGGGGDKPPWFYAAQVARTYWPWMLVLAPACVAAARGRLGRRVGPRRLVRWGAVWTAGWLVLLTAFPDRRDRYAVVLYPSMAALCGAWLARAGAARRCARGSAEAGTGGRAAARLARRRWPLGVAAGAAVFAALPVRVHRPIDPQWPALMAWLRQRGSPQVWEGAFSGPHGSRLYLEFGRWPIPTRDRQGRRVAEPPPGALVIYHAEDGPGPGEGERRVYPADSDTAGEVFITSVEGTRGAPASGSSPPVER